MTSTTSTIDWAAWLVNYRAHARLTARTASVAAVQDLGVSVADDLGPTPEVIGTTAPPTTRAVWTDWPTPESRHMRPSEITTAAYGYSQPSVRGSAPSPKIKPKTSKGWKF